MTQKKKKKKKKKASFSKKALLISLRGIFVENPDKKLNYKQASKLLGITDFNTKLLLVELLDLLKESSFLKEEKRGHYRLFKQGKKLICTVKNTSSRGVYVDLNGGDEAFVPAKHSMFALAGDEVEIRLLKLKKGKKSAEITRVIKRKKEFFVGKIDSSSSNYFLVPDNKKIPFDVFIPSKNIKKQSLDKKVLVEITLWDSGNKNPVGKIIKTLGSLTDHCVAIDSIVYDHGLTTSFKEEVLDFAEKKKVSLSKKDLKERLDFRKTTTFTIDPKDAKDFDDALSVKSLPSGNWEIGVHIADVSHYVIEGDILDEEALKRGNSVYLTQINNLPF